MGRDRDEVSFKGKRELNHKASCEQEEEKDLTSKWWTKSLVHHIEALKSSTLV